MNKMRVGIFGGTFNPPHIGHISAAQAFLKGANLDKLIIMPAFIPPHKEYDSLTTCEDRLEMCKLAFKGVPKTEVSDLEIQRGGKSYTYLTLGELSSEESELYFLCGTDMILTMDTWMHPEVIFNLANICYIRRESDPVKKDLIEMKCKKYVDDYNARILPIDSEVIEISSSDLRNGEKDVDAYLTDDVLEYIMQKELYK